MSDSQKPGRSNDQRDGHRGDPEPPSPDAAALLRAPSDELLPHLEGADDRQAEQEWSADQETVRRLGLPRDLPVVPPGERRVSRTVMGVGNPELQSAFKARLAGASPPPRPAVPAFAALPTPNKPAAARTAGLAAPPPGPSQPAPSPGQLEPSAGPSNPSPPGGDVFGKTAPMPVMEQALLAAKTSDVPAPSLPASLPEAPIEIQPRTVELRPTPPPRATPTAATHGVAGPKPSGPSNWVLIVLWAVALISVGLAVFLYLR